MRDRILLVGTDLGVRGDDAIVEGLTQLSAGVANVLHVLHVIEPGKSHELSGRPELVQEEHALASGPSALLRRIQYDAVLNGLPFRASHIHAHVRLGKPIETLLQACVDYNADMLIVGTHGRQGIQRLLIGSVAEQLLRQAHCPVLIARSKSYHGLTKSQPPSSESRLV